MVKRNPTSAYIDRPFTNTSATIRRCQEEHIIGCRKNCSPPKGTVKERNVPLDNYNVNQNTPIVYLYLWLQPSCHRSYDFHIESKYHF